MRRGEINPCYRPPLGSSKVDLAELHVERMRDRKAATARRYAKHQDWLRKGGDNVARWFAKHAPGSLADQQHEHKREIARRARQQAARG